MNIIQNLPVLRLLFPFLLGILFYINLKLDYSGSFYLLLGFGIVFFLFSGILNKQWKSRWFTGILLNTILILAGIAVTQANDLSQNKNHFRYQTNDTHTFAIACIEEAPKISTKTYKVILSIKKIIVNQEIKHDVTGKIMAYFSKEIPIDSLRPGRILIINFKPKEINPPSNPGEFNYKRYLSFHGIYHQQFFRNQDVSFPPIDGTKRIKNAAWKLREEVLEILKKIKSPLEDFGVLAALVTGHEEDLTSDTLRAYSTTGALHVLSVSGMHVGIIFLMLDLILKHLEKIKHGKSIRLILSLCALWFYAFFTGLSPSVLRACTMFSFLQTGKYFQKSPNSLNTLLSSGFVLLLINPYLATEVGFQLSFCAVGGIIIFYQRIYKIYQPSTWIMKQAWSITAVSLAAQLSTFPMGLLYFHQFPNYFLLSNLIIIPLTTIILYAGMLYIMVSPIAFVNSLVGWITNYLLYFLRKMVGVFETLPYAQLNGVDFSITETFTTYGLIVFISLFLIHKKLNHLMGALFLLVVLSSLSIYDSIQQKNNIMISIYSSEKNNAIGFLKNKNLLLLSEKEFLENESAQRFHCYTHWYQWGIEEKLFFEIGQKEITSLPLQLKKSDNIILFQNKIILINPKIEKTPSRKIDLIFLTNKNIPDSSIEALAHYMKNSAIVLGSNLPSYKIEKWKKIFLRKNVKAHSISRDGYFEMKI